MPANLVLTPLPPGAAAFEGPRPLHHLALAIAVTGCDAAEQALTDSADAVRPGRHPVEPSRTMDVDDADGNEVELIAPLTV